MRKLNFYSPWINERSCEPEEAACLISGLDPQLIVRKNPYIQHVIEVNNAEVAALAHLLRPHNEIWSFNIFHYTNLALGNNYTVSKVLIKEINLFALNLIEEHLIKFNKIYPYLYRKQPPDKKVTKNHQADILSPQEKYVKWQETANIINNRGLKLNKKSLVAQVFQELKKKEPNYVMKSEGVDYPLSTISRQITLPKN